MSSSKVEQLRNSLRILNKLPKARPGEPSVGTKNSKSQQEKAMDLSFPPEVPGNVDAFLSAQDVFQSTLPTGGLSESEVVKRLPKELHGVSLLFHWKLPADGGAFDNDLYYESFNLAGMQYERAREIEALIKQCFGQETKVRKIQDLNGEAFRQFCEWRLGRRKVVIEEYPPIKKRGFFKRRTG